MPRVPAAPSASIAPMGLPGSISLAVAAGMRAELVWAKHHEVPAGERFASVETPVYSLWLVEQGEVELSSPDGKWAVGPGQVLFAAPSHQREVRSLAPSRWLSAGLHLTTPQGGDAFEHLTNGVFEVEAPHVARLRSLLELLNDMAYWSGEAGELARDGLTRALAAWLLGVLGAGQPVPHAWPAWLKACLAQAELRPDITVEELAGEAYFSSAQLRRHFLRYLGVTPREYLSRRRLERARIFLELGEHSVQKVAELAGFGGLAQLSRDFRRHYGLSPLQWKLASREAP